MSADTIVPDPTDPQSYNRYSYVRNNPLILIDPSGHCWGFASGMRDTFYGTTCNNIDTAVSIVQHPDASVGEKIVAGGYIAVEAVAHGVVAGGSAIIAGEAVVAAVPYAGSAIAAAESAAIAHPTASAVVGGVAETAVECSMSGGGCGLADYALGAATAGVAHRLSTPCSFSEETLVTTADGLVPISEIAEGTLVLAYNENTGETDYYEVMQVWAHEDPVIVFLTIDGELVETTPEHPFYVNEYGWVEARNLWQGAELFSANETYGTVEIINYEPQTQIMWDLTVDSVHTFFVGEEQWLVHNCDDGVLFHYTDASGAEGINASGTIRPNSQGQVYVTGGKVSSANANSALFAGNPNYGSKGSHVVEFTAVDGLSLHPGTQPNELIHYGSLRNGRNINVIRIGENKFGPE